jgi:hypothetical protein
MPCTSATRWYCALRASLAQPWHAHKSRHYYSPDTYVALHSNCKQAVEPAELALPVLVSAIRGGPSFFSTLAAGLVVAELGVVVATQNPVLSVVAGLPLLGGAALLSAVAGVLGDLKTGAALRPIKAAAQGTCTWSQRC